MGVFLQMATATVDASADVVPSQVFVVAAAVRSVAPDSRNGGAARASAGWSWQREECQWWQQHQ